MLTAVDLHVLDVEDMVKDSRSYRPPNVQGFRMQTESNLTPFTKNGKIWSDLIILSQKWQTFPADFTVASKKCRATRMSSLSQNLDMCSILNGASRRYAKCLCSLSDVSSMPSSYLRTTFKNIYLPWELGKSEPFSWIVFVGGAIYLSWKWKNMLLTYT